MVALPFDLAARQGARRGYPRLGLDSPEQRRMAAKSMQPFRREQDEGTGGVARSFQPAEGMRVARSLPLPSSCSTRDRAQFFNSLLSYQPRLLIPLAGMIFGNAMNAMSLAAERFESERNGGVEVILARSRAFRAAMIPQINSFLSVGLVSLPGMMTGQVLAGVSPLVAVRYQILIMAMILGTAGLTTALYFLLTKAPQPRQIISA
jgi:hypothetical protein